MAAPSMQALQVRAADYNPKQFGGGGNLTYDPRQRLDQLEAGFRSNPGRAPNGSGSTGLMSGDSRGYSRMLEEQQEYMRLRSQVASMPQESAPAPPPEAQARNPNRFQGKGMSNLPQTPTIPVAAPAAVPTPSAPQPEEASAPDLPELAPAAMPTAGGGGSGGGSNTPIQERGGSALNPNVGRRVRPVSMRVLVGRLY